MDRTPLHIAALSGNLEESFSLLARGADINARDDDGQTPLFLAVERRDLALVRYLACQGAEVNLTDRYGNTVLDCAVSNGDVKVASYLSSCGAQLALLEKDLLKRRELLRARISDSPLPHIVNQQMIDIESALRICRVWSFPYRVSLSISNRCNAKCVFCYYPGSETQKTDFMSVPSVMRMTWLKYVWRLHFCGDMGDTLTNPDFLPIFEYLADAFPHLDLHLSTNGIGLTERIVEALVGRLSHLNVSLNAATDEIWQGVMRKPKAGFSRVVRVCEYLDSLKKERGIDTPQVSISMVMLKENIDEVPAFVDLANRLGATRVRLNDYRTQHHIGQKDLHVKGSLYSEPERHDRSLATATAKAKEYGIALFSPEPFTSASFITQGRRSHLRKQCTDPWRICILTHRPDEQLRRELNPCCVGFTSRIFLEEQNLS